MRRRTAQFLPFLLAALLTNALALPQQPQTTPAPTQQTPGQERADDDEVVRISTNLVQVDAVVTDKDGRQVTDLTADNFEVVENGHSREITNFSYVRVAEPTTAPAPARKSAAAAAPPVPPARLRAEQVQRTITIVVDDLLMSHESIYLARAALRKYVDEQIQPGDLVSIVRTRDGVGALQQFTNDRRQLYRAIDRIRWWASADGFATGGDPQDDESFGKPTPGNVDGDRSGGKDDYRSFGKLTPGGVDDERSGGKDYQTYREERLTVGLLGSLKFVVEGLREMPGRKAVVLFADGLPLVGMRGETATYTPFFQSLVDLANRASVVFYTVDARGLQPTGPTAEYGMTAGGPLLKSVPPGQLGGFLRDRSNSIFQSQGGLKLLAESTGGMAHLNSNDINKGIRRALDDMGGYYLIGYRPDPDSFNPDTGRPRFNSLKVKVKGRSGLNVRSRSGYVGRPENAVPPRPRTRAEQLMAALVSPFGAGGVNLRLTSLFIDAPGGGQFLRSMLLIDPRALTFERQPDGRQQTKLDLVAVTFGEDGRVVDQLNRVETVSVPAGSFERVLEEGMVYDLNLPVTRPGAYQLRVAVRETATEKTGSASQYVEVPDLSKKRLALSGIVAASPAAAQGAPADRQGDPAVRRFRRGSLLDYGFVVYNAKPDRATGRPRLTIQARLFRDGRQVYAGEPQPFDPPQQTGLERIEAAGRLQLGASLAPGEYVLQVVVNDALADKSRSVATQWIDFELVN